MNVSHVGLSEAKQVQARGFEIFQRGKYMASAATMANKRDSVSFADTELILQSATQYRKEF